MDKQDALTTITTLVVGATAVGSFLPRFDQLNNEDMNLNDLESVRIGEIFCVGITVVSGLLASYATRSLAPFVASTLLSFSVLSMYEYRVSGYSVV